MKSVTNLLIMIILTPFLSCNNEVEKADLNIIFLHHSTGDIIWNGRPPSLVKRAVRKLNDDLADKISRKPLILSLFEEYKLTTGKNYIIEEVDFPKASPYGWNNNPYDYYNIWVKNAGELPYKEEPTLEILTKNYQLIIFKHCYPVSNIRPDSDSADINSARRTMANYKLQYTALRDKLHEFPDTKFILFTGAAQVKAHLAEDEAVRAQKFFEWVRNEWDLPDDNIYLWDLYSLETEGSLYFKYEYAISPTDSHPNEYFASRVSRLLFNRIIDVIENNGNGTTLTGEKI
jgi:hypothetical protein